jgi:hypothetical protein
VVLTAYLSVWMGRRCAGVVALVSAWIAGAISAIGWSRRFKLWLGLSCLYVYCRILFCFVEICPLVGTWRILYDDVFLTMVCICWRYINCIPLWLLRYFIYAWWLWILLRRSVYFLNICYIRVFYRFNRNRALQRGGRE